MSTGLGPMLAGRGDAGCPGGPEPGERPPFEADGWPQGFAAGPANRRAVLVLASLRGITPRRLLELAAREGTAAACLAAIRHGKSGSAQDREMARAVDPKAVATGLVACEARMVLPGTAEYPASLEDLADPPAALFVRGASLLRIEPRVAVVGARNPTPLGREVARSLGRGLAEAGVCVVSGAARGIDTEAHLGALAAGGPTAAVLGCGIDRPYPPRNRSLIERISMRGAVVSEYPPGVPAEAFRFPARNRIVAALSLGVVVVEGAAGSGSLITAEHALDIGRPVFAVPGPVTNPLSEAPLALIRDGATLIRDPRDVLGDLGLEPVASPREGDRGDDDSDPSGPQLSSVERAALSHLGGAILPEHLARTMGCTVGEVIPVLLQLELRGLVRSVGGRYERRLL